MLGLILCAGRGVRAREYTRDIPKCMVEVGGKPVLERAADHLAKKYDVSRIVVNLSGHHPDSVMNYFGQRFLYLFEPVPMGKENTVALVKRWSHNEDIVTANGDTIILRENSKNKKHCGITYFPAGSYEGTRLTGYDFVDIGTREGLLQAKKLWKNS